MKIKVKPVALTKQFQQNHLYKQNKQMNPPVDHADFVALLLNMVEESLANAFGPNGIGTNAINNAFGPDGVGRSINYTLEISRVRALNAGATRDNDTIHPLPDPNHNIPQMFPETLQALKTLRGAQADALLQTYNLPLGGSLPDKRQRLADYVGIQLRNLLR